MFVSTITRKWIESSGNRISEIEELRTCGVKGWTIREGQRYGVAIPISEEKCISESFSGARLGTAYILIENQIKIYVLMLICENPTIQEPFAALCAEFINPGESGTFRKEIEENPLRWWTQWKELLGNKNVEEKVYDVLGELLCLRYLAASKRNAEWNGPTGATYDIDCEDEYYEVKSTLSRNKKEVTISNHFQLEPPAGTALYLVFCQFETAITGVCINDVLNELVSLGYNRLDLEKKLELLGLEKGKSARDKKYILHAISEYKIDDKFPSITKKSFKNDCLPVGIQSITYTVSLDGLESKAWDYYDI